MAKQHRISILRSLTAATLVLAAGIAGQASSVKAEEAAAAPEKSAAEVETAPAESKKTSYELRFTIMSPTIRWSKVDPALNTLLQLHANRSLYYGPGIGFRTFIKQPHHGLLVEFDYKVDSDVDSLNSDTKWKTDFAMARVGYAYRFIRHGNARMTWAFTPHASFSAGGTINRSQGDLIPEVADAFTSRSAVIGGRVGVNIDLHIERFFMGWALEYEGLKHVSGAPLGSSHLVQFTLIPIFRIGVDLGPTIQSL
jgi:hypothetical protein